MGFFTFYVEKANNVEKWRFLSEFLIFVNALEPVLGATNVMQFSVFQLFAEYFIIFQCFVLIYLYFLIILNFVKILCFACVLAHFLLLCRKTCKNSVSAPKTPFLVIYLKKMSQNRNFCFLFKLRQFAWDLSHSVSKRQKTWRNGVFCQKF